MKRACIILFLLWLLFFIKGYVFLDPDFGFHLRTGEMILQSGIPRADALSYTMPGFPLIDHEWMLDAALAVLYPMIGMSGLSAIAATMAVSVLVLSLFSAGRTIRSLQHPTAAIPIVLASTVLLPFAGVRPQVVTWFFLSILFWLLAGNRKWTKRQFLIPALFLLWANVHGGFAVGLVMLFLSTVISLLLSVFRSEFTGYRSIRLKNRKLTNQIQTTENRKPITGLISRNVWILFFSILATFINPYGFRLYQEVWMSFTDSRFRWTIAEWHPTVLYVDFGIIVFTALSFVFILRRWRRFPKEMLIIYLVFLFAAIGSLRNVPLWIIVALPMTIAGIAAFIREEITTRDAQWRWKRVQPIVIAIVLVLVTHETFAATNSAFAWRESVAYPQRAITYLKNHPSDGQLFSYFAWGGYLDWKLPEKKVFIDGRMTGWKRQGIAGESDSVFEEYLGVITGKQPVAEVMKRYNVDTVLWPIADITKRYTLLDIWDEQINRYVFPSKQKKYPHLVDQLLQGGWIVAWKDETSVVLRKKSIMFL